MLYPHPHQPSNAWRVPVNHGALSIVVEGQDIPHAQDFDIMFRSLAQEKRIQVIPLGQLINSRPRSDAINLWEYDFSLSAQSGVLEIFH